MTAGSRRARKPLVSSTVALRALATAITLCSFGGMTIVASENLYVSNAPLQPSAVATAAPAPTAAPTTTPTTRTTVTPSVTSTTATAVTRTRQS